MGIVFVAKRNSFDSSLDVIPLEIYGIETFEF